MQAREILGKTRALTGLAHLAAGKHLFHPGLEVVPALLLVDDGHNLGHLLNLGHGFAALDGPDAYYFNLVAAQPVSVFEKLDDHIVFFIGRFRIPLVKEVREEERSHVQAVAIPEKLNAVTIECGALGGKIAILFRDRELEVVSLINVWQFNVYVYVSAFCGNDERYHTFHRELLRGVVHVAIEGVIPYFHAFVVIV